MDLVADPSGLINRAQGLWDEEVLPTLEAYIRIPNLSPHFAPSWKGDGHMDKVAELIAAWCRSRPIEGISVDVVRIDDLTPSILIDIPAHGELVREGGDPGILFYGHMDKQPEFPGWRDGLGPWTPVREGDRLYGRGSADDGYAVFAALTSVEALRAAGGSHSRCVILIEGSEESGSPDLPTVLDSLAEKIGQPTLVVALDTGCASYDRLWATNTLRGLVGGTLTVTVLEQGVHSGSAGGIVPSSFRIARILLSRVENENTGEILLSEFWEPISQTEVDQAKAVAQAAGDTAVGPFPTIDGLQLSGEDTADRILRHTLEPAMAVIGAEGMPDLISAGNVLRPYTSLQLSFRLPPRCDTAAAAKAVERVLTTDPPYGAKVTFEVDGFADGWAAPRLEPWLEKAMNDASIALYGKPFGSSGEGGSIPFMAMLGERYPKAQIFATGVLGPGSNADGPNEFLDIPTAVKLTAALGIILHEEGKLEQTSGENDLDDVGVRFFESMEESLD